MSCWAIACCTIRSLTVGIPSLRTPPSGFGISVSPALACTSRFGFPRSFLYWASTCLAALPSHIAFYAVSVRQARGLPVVSLFPHPASFRFHLAMDTLAFGYLLPAAGRIRVFHPLETCAAGRTKTIKGVREQYPPGSLLRFALVQAAFILLSIKTELSQIHRQVSLRSLTAL